MSMLNQDTSRALVQRLEKAKTRAAYLGDLARRREEDFKFMVLCESKNNMAMYRLLRDRSLDDES